MDKCKKCICTQCKTLFKIDPLNCEYSDCKWCINEQTSYTMRCGRYLDKGVTYGNKPEE